MDQPSSISYSAERKLRETTVKRLMTLMLALALVVGGAAVVLAQDQPTPNQGTNKKAKKKKKKQGPTKPPAYLEESAPNYAG
jgi:hypothetical protein